VLVPAYLKDVPQCPAGPNKGNADYSLNNTITVTMGGDCAFGQTPSPHPYYATY